MSPNRPLFTNEIVEALLQKLDEIQTSYNQLILLIGIAGSGKTTILRALERTNNSFKFSYVNVNLSLSKRLINLNTCERRLDLLRILKDIVSEEKGDVLLLDNTEILFDKTLAQDPIKCLTSTSRGKRVIASWSGNCSNGLLTYACPNNPEFQEYKVQDIGAWIQTISSGETR